MNPIRTITRRSTIALTILALTGCAGVGLGQTIGDWGLPSGGREVRGQVRQVNSRAREIQIQASNGRAVTLDYDSRTRVVFQNRNYSLSSLERGDYVSARVSQDNRRSAYVDRIIVERSARDARGGGRYDGPNNGRGNGRNDGRNDNRTRQTFNGRVGRIDYQRGYFQLEQGRDNYTVAMPYRPSDATLTQFRRLRAGDRVRFDGVFLSRDRVEVQRFR